MSFFLRVPKHYVFSVNGRELKAESLLQSRSECKVDNISVLGIQCISAGMKKVIDKPGKPDYIIVVTNRFAYEALRSYKKRCSIEVMF